MQRHLARAVVRGFTLIELLVVIAVIAILAALLFPALNRAKNAADSAGCRSNLRQIMFAMTMYVQDYKVYPETVGGVVGSANSVLRPFTGAPAPEANYTYRTGGPSSGTYLGPQHSVWACPGYNRIQGELGPRAMGSDGASYAYNGNGSIPDVDYGLGLGGKLWALVDTMTQVESPTPTREAQVLYPSDMIAMGDAALFPDRFGFGHVRGSLWLGIPLDVNWAGGFWNTTVRGLPANDSSVAALRRRHNGRWNIGFCDGHVESFRPIDLFDITKAAVAQRWNNDHLAHLEDNYKPPQFPPPPP